MLICIDPGHGGSDPGAVVTQNQRNLINPDDDPNIHEADLNLSISKMLESQIAQVMGSDDHKVAMTRRCDRSLSLTSRARFANRMGAHLFVSIHCNASASQMASGIETFHFSGSRLGKPMAFWIQQSMLEMFPNHRDRGIKTANFTVLRKTLMPAVLVECEFMTHRIGLQHLLSRQNLIAESIAIGIKRGFRAWDAMV